MPRGAVATLPFTDDDGTPHDGQSAALSSAVWRWTSRTPPGSSTTCSTRTPANPNGNVVSLLKLVASSTELSRQQPVFRGHEPLPRRQRPRVVPGQDRRAILIAGGAGRWPKCGVASDSAGAVLSTCLDADAHQFYLRSVGQLPTAYRSAAGTVSACPTAGIAPYGVDARRDGPAFLLNPLVEQPTRRTVPRRIVREPHKRQRDSWGHARQNQS
ncbi:hypothetical protein EV644_1348 [Kribbella orskensis]|uniref:Uncharacterized protein n=1 Tax=Kribbella orskensis TaxID=2512216 RepID=A0ABY2B7Q8_9ACTN|nr:hypothetical protein EV642_1367 [Kribbella sp. VKM Ac-2500]TCO10260.1 hypothetical protein EV644_1348 [Kribbella orskensis]